MARSECALMALDREILHLCKAPGVPEAAKIWYHAGLAQGATLPCTGLQKNRDPGHKDAPQHPDPP